MSQKAFKSQLKEIKEQLHRFELEVWQERRRQKTKYKWYEAILSQIETIAFSINKKLYPNKQSKIEAIKTLFNQITMTILYDKATYPWYNGWKNSDGYGLAEHIKDLIYQATYKIWHQQSELKSTNNEDHSGRAGSKGDKSKLSALNTKQAFANNIAKAEFDNGQSLKTLSWSAINYEDTIKLWKELRQLWVDKNRLLVRLKTAISHFEPIVWFDYEQWINEHVSEYNQCLIYQTNKNPVEKLVFSQFKIQTIMVQLNQFTNLISDLEQHGILEYEIKNVLNDLKANEIKIETAIANVLANLEQKVLQTNDCFQGEIHFDFLINKSLRFFHNGKKLWFSSSTMQTINFNQQKLSFVYYQPISNIMANQIDPKWLNLLECDYDHMSEHEQLNYIKALENYLQTYQLLIQTKQEVGD